MAGNGPEADRARRVIISIIEGNTDSLHTERVTILVVSPDEERLKWLKEALHSAEFRLVAARALDEAWTKSDSFEIGAVVIDYELKNDIAASAFRQRFITLDLNEDAAPENVVMELTNLFSRGSELVQ